MKIQKIKYQYAEPCEKYTKTRNANYKFKTTTKEYYNASFEKNYIIEDELEFLKALKHDLEQQLQQTDKDIKKLEKTR